MNTTPPSPADVQNGVADGAAKDIALPVRAEYDIDGVRRWFDNRNLPVSVEQIAAALNASSASAAGEVKSLCVCGEPNALRVQHRTDGPCIQLDPPSCAPDAKGKHWADKASDVIEKVGDYLTPSHMKAPDAKGLPKEPDWQPQVCRCGGFIRQQLMGALICGSCGRSP